MIRSSMFGMVPTLYRSRSAILDQPDAYIALWSVRMQIAVMAAGAVGGYFGARMAAAGHDVTFIARGAHRDAIHRDGSRSRALLATFT